MVTFKCVEKDCKQKDLEITFTGELDEAECGGCHVVLQSYNFRPDPELLTE